MLAQKVKESEITEQDSLLLTGNLLLIPIFNISYIRGLFPEKYFNDKSVPALEMKIMDAELRRLIDWMEKGVYDALQKKYLRTLLFCICERVDGPMIEEYAFSFSYLNSDSQEVSMNINRKGSKKGATINFNSYAEITPSQMRSSACKMVRTLSQPMRTLDNIPEEYTILMKLRYYDDVKPMDYEPPFFRGCIEEAAVNIWTRSPLKMEVGNVNCKHFVLALKGVLDHCEDENDDYQNDVSLGDENSESDSETFDYEFDAGKEEMEVQTIAGDGKAGVTGVIGNYIWTTAKQVRSMEKQSKFMARLAGHSSMTPKVAPGWGSTTSKSLHSSLFSPFTPIRHPRVPSRVFSTETIRNLLDLWGNDVAKLQINTPYIKLAIMAAAVLTVVKKPIIEMAHDGLLGVLRGKQYQVGDQVEFNGKVGKIMQKSKTQIFVVFEAKSGGIGAFELFRNTETTGLRNITLWERYKIDSKKRIERALWWEGLLWGEQARDLKAEELVSKQKHLEVLPFKHRPSQK